MCDKPAAATNDAAAGPEAEIEITPEMIEAGYRVFAASGITDVPGKADKLVLAEIFEAMSRGRQTSLV
jgi:hypothetical protein